jgi:MFS family permease
MVGGTIADIFETKDRGTPMNLFGVGSLAGTGIGPLVAGFIYSNPHLGWRYPPWLTLLI